jgi:glutamine kinase
MKLIVLAAGKGSAPTSETGGLPPCLHRFDESSTVLDTILGVGRAAEARQAIVVGGYRILDIMQAYPSLKYYYSPDWQSTGALASLLQAAPEFNDDLLIAYSDVVYEKRTADLLLGSRGELVAAYDSTWQTRYEGRTDEILEEAEKLYRYDSGALAVSRGGLDRGTSKGATPSLLGEYAGLLYLRRGVVEDLASVGMELAAGEPKAGVPELINVLSRRVASTPADLKGRWAELDSEQDLAHFRFGTKAETLLRLEGRLTRSKILPQLTVRVGEWLDDPEGVRRAVRATFGGGAVVVRSSALNEDTEAASLAGNYESVLGVPADEAGAVATAMERVRESFLKGGAEEERENQILIQPMLDGVRYSGVAFTADLETSAPYYIANYDPSGSTDSVTSGGAGSHRTFIYYKDALKLPEEPELALLVEGLREIEEKTGFSSLDIEFAVAGGAGARQRADTAAGDLELFIFQVRPIAAHKRQLRVAPQDVAAELSGIVRYIEADSRDPTVLCGGETAYGVMPDWNPAEIIGINPRPLAFSLYRYIITDAVWGRSREECGYRRTAPRPGIVSFGGKPYVDIRMSFTSFTPASLGDDLAHRLVEHYIRTLKAQPELHDKVEFQVAITAFDLAFDRRLEELAKAGFSEADLRQVRGAFLELTDAIISGRSVSVDGELERVSALSLRRDQIDAAHREGHLSAPAAVHALLEECKDHGTLPFSNLARFAFIGVIQLKGLVARGLFTQERYDAFLGSIKTVAKEFLADLAKAGREELIQKYGHLRPGTYDITSPSYHEAFDRYIDLSTRPDPEEQQAFALTDAERSTITEELEKAGFSVDADALFSYIRKAVQGRELGKFEFSKALSRAMDIIVEWASGLGLTRDEASFLEIADIIDLSGGSAPAHLPATLRNRIERRRNRHLITAAIHLPEVIRGTDDLYGFFLSDSRPNFITQSTVTAEIRLLEGIDPDIEGKICLIENADPGFDWIFSHDIAGLVTKYGGANSHMAIRCAEFGIPAAIGCGEAIFSRLEKARRVHLDCGGKTIEVVQ